MYAQNTLLRGAIAAVTFISIAGTAFAMETTTQTNTSTGTGTTTETVTSTGVTATGSTSTGTVRNGKKKTADLTCLAPLFATREDAILASWTKESTAIQAAMTARKTSIAAALQLTDVKEVKKAIAAAHKTFRESVKDARSVSKTERKATWEAFRTGAKSCAGVKPQSLESSGASSQDIQ